jgi:heme exporter protein D
VNAYVAAGYGITLVTLAAYALRTLRRGRALSRAAQDHR